MRAWLLVALLALSVEVGASQYQWTTTGTFATHELPDDPIPLGEVFIISGTLRGTGTTDVVEVGGLDVEGCSILSEVTHEPSDLVVGWHARLRMDAASCSWVRVGNYTDTALGGQEPVTVVVAAGNVVAFTMHDYGQDPGDGVWGAWFLPILFLGLAVVFWVRGDDFPGIVAFFAGLALVVPVGAFQSRPYIILIMALAIVLHHYWGSLAKRIRGRRSAKT